ncbi:MAG: hypothetical protein EB153_05590 [Nitrosopumilaceae archaeon]|nr:hypothetical protein [Nitrosopumilaceae archaeon]
MILDSQIKANGIWFLTTAQTEMFMDSDEAKSVCYLSLIRDYTSYQKQKQSHSGGNQPFKDRL